MKKIIVYLIKFYRTAISPFFPPSCRFYPTCSVYAQDAVIRFGILKGGWLFLKRLAKCHPFHHGGYDPVPPSKIED